MPGDAPNSRARSENARTFSAKPAKLPAGLNDAIDAAVAKALLRAIRKVPALRRTIVEKIYQIDPRAYQQGIELSAKLNEQFLRADALLKELRAERERILRFT